MMQQRKRPYSSPMVVATITADRWRITAPRAVPWSLMARALEIARRRAW